MEKGSIFSFGVIIFILSIAGCSSEGGLKISNKTSGTVFGEVNNHEFQLNSGENYEDKWDLSTSIFGNETKNLEITYNGEYIWRETISAEVEAGSTKRIKLLPVAGAIRVINTSATENIVEVNITSESEALWGDNDLPEGRVLAPGDSLGWTVSAGNWDIRIIGDNNIESVVNNLMVEVDSTQIIPFNRLDNSKLNIEKESKNLGQFNKVEIY